MKTDELIQKLAKEAGPIRKLSSLSRRLAFWLAAALLFLIPGVLLRGVRPDLAHQVVSCRFMLEGLLILALSGFSALAALALSVPGDERSAWTRWAPAVALTAWLMLLGAHMGRIVFSSGPSTLSTGSGLFCVRDILLLSLLPGAWLMVMIRRAAPVELGLSGVLAALSAASFAALGTQFTCSIDDPLHIVVWHAATVVVIAGAGIVFGKRFLRW